MEITIRPVTRDELPETVQIYLECTGEDYYFIPQAYLESRSATEELAECEDWVYGQGEPNRIFAAFSGPVMVGYTAVGMNTGEPQGYEGEVSALFVRRSYRSRGIGLALLRSGLDYLRGLGYSKVIIYNYRASQSNGYYHHLSGEVVYRTVQMVGGASLETDVFAWEIEHFLEILRDHLQKYDYPEGAARSL